MTQQNLAAVRPVTPEFLFEFFMELSSLSRPAFDFGDTPTGRRTTGTISGGWISGPRITARVLEGTDYAVSRPDDVLVPNIKCVVQTDDDALILISYTGIITPWSKVLEARRGNPVDLSDLEWKVNLSFETSAPRYDWLNRTLAVGRGTVAEGGFPYAAYELV